MTELVTLETQLMADVAAATDEQSIEAIRVAALGKKGSVSELLKTLGSMSPEERQTRGAAINALKNSVTEAINARKGALKDAAIDAKLKAETVDVSLPVRSSPAERGRIHPISQIVDEITAIFGDMGFSIAEGPDVETDYYNFTALNFPEGHPAREMHDTFFFQPDEKGERKVLRTHTSPVQIRAGEMHGAPTYVIAPGRVYRSDSDATHTPMFHQIEGLVLDKGITLGHLKWTLETFLRAFFERDDVVLRMRPSYFPFTEPSAEVDVGWSMEKGRRVVGGQEGWMEVLGSGMVHPRVIANIGLDPNEWQGFAFGCGIDRLAMLKYGMDDLRAFFDGDIRWLKHYGFRALDVPTLSGGVGA